MSYVDLCLCASPRAADLVFSCAPWAIQRSQVIFFLEPKSLRYPRKALECGHFWQNRVSSRIPGNTKNVGCKRVSEKHRTKGTCDSSFGWYSSISTTFLESADAEKDVEDCNPQLVWVRSTWAPASPELTIPAEMVLQYLHFTPLLPDNHLLTWHTAEHEAAALPLPLF